LLLVHQIAMSRRAIQLKMRKIIAFLNKKRDRKIIKLLHCNKYFAKANGISAKKKSFFEHPRFLLCFSKFQKYILLNNDFENGIIYGAKITEGLILIY